MNIIQKFKSLLSRSDKGVLEISLFDNKGLENALKTLCWTVGTDDILRNKNNRKVRCMVCKKPLKKSDISAFIPLKKGVGTVCSNLHCFFVAEYKSKGDSP